MKVHPKSFSKLATGTPVLVSGDPGKLLYAYARKNFLYDKEGNLTDEFDLVAHRCGYAPDSGEHLGRPVDSVHCSAGLFTLETP